MKKKFKIGIAIILTVVAVGAGAGIIAWNYIPKNALTIKKEINNVENDISSYFTDNIFVKPLWFYKSDETPWKMSFQKHSIRQDCFNKNKLFATINLEKFNSTKHNIKAITINLDWRELGGSRYTEWNQMTNEINNLGYHNNSNSISGNDVKKYIDQWILTSGLNWYETTNNNKITFTTSNVKINNDGAFTEDLIPNSTIDGNKDVHLVLKWLKTKDENTDEIVSAIKASGYTNKPSLIWRSMVKQEVNDYLSDEIWVINDSKRTQYKFIATKVIISKDSNWIVTLDQDTLLKTRDLSFTPFNITLDWKDRDDATFKLNEIDIQIAKNNYGKKISSDTVLILFTNFINSGIWTFYNEGGVAQKITIMIDEYTPGRGIIANPSPGYTWEISTMFSYSSKLAVVNIDLNWVDMPNHDKIYSDIMRQYNKDKNYTYAYRHK